jgi:hypothetical protein
MSDGAFARSGLEKARVFVQAVLEPVSVLHFLGIARIANIARIVSDDRDPRPRPPARCCEPRLPAAPSARRPRQQCVSRVPQTERRIPSAGAIRFAPKIRGARGGDAESRPRAQHAQGSPRDAGELPVRATDRYGTARHCLARTSRSRRITAACLATSTRTSRKHRSSCSQKHRRASPIAMIRMPDVGLAVLASEPRLVATAPEKREMTPGTLFLGLESWTHVDVTVTTASATVSVESASAVEEESPRKPDNTMHKAKLDG